MELDLPKLILPESNIIIQKGIRLGLPEATRRSRGARLDIFPSACLTRPPDF